GLGQRLLFCLNGSLVLQQTTHSLRYFRTAVSDPEPGLPAYVSAQALVCVSGFHTLQRRSGCEIREDGSIGGSRQLAYDGDDFLRFDMNTYTWVVAVKEAEITQCRRNEETADLQYRKQYTEKDVLSEVRGELGVSVCCSCLQTPSPQLPLSGNGKLWPMGAVGAVTAERGSGRGEPWGSQGRRGRVTCGGG
uniref:MHC class I-like antigen recognition-like domain-containing protein n=1 Tax=Terrapene triunguis TaxID=2587831 RepID=A0A674J968_9SAUR